MPEYNIKLTWEAIYDVTDIADYIEAEFGQGRADRFQTDIGNAMETLGKIFYIIADATGEIHVLRVLREERNWENVLKSQHAYTYPE